MRKVIPRRAKLIPKNAKLVFKGIIHDVYQWDQEMFDGSHATFEMLKRPDTIKVIAVKDQKILITEQQQPDDEVFYDVPGGRHDVESEDELDAAKRELLEETGLTFRNWKLLDVRQTHPKIDQFIYIFLATDFEGDHGQQLESGEKISVQWMTLDEVKGLVDGPKTRYLPTIVLDKVSSIDELIHLPAYS